ncbi:MAG TPA: protein kinase [Vicinamibacteria bacterium]|nr:protein kinase [Vicinamibacteria bacterium]
MDFTLNNPLILWGLGLVALVVVYQKVAPLLRIRVPGSGMSRQGLLDQLLGPRFREAKREREAMRLKKQGDYMAAGKMLEDMNRTQEAAELYLEGQEYWAAAATFERLGKAERAAELYLSAGDYKKAAQLFVNAGKPAKAAALFGEKGNNLEAARLFGLAGQWDKAADLYVKSGYPLRAAEAYEKQGEFVKAAEAHEKHFQENVSFATTYSSTAPSADQKSALFAGRLFEKAGQLDRAFQAYSKGGYFKEAAGALEKLGQFKKAGELYMRAEDSESAARVFEQGGDPVNAALLRGEVAFKADRRAEAAAHFVKGHDFLRAAELFESVGQLAEAASAFEAGESWAAAGGVYMRAGLKERAAAAYEKGAEYETAAKLYEESGHEAKAAELYGRAGQTFKSGEAAARAGERDKAIGLLQRVGPSDENYRSATELLARLFIESRNPALALERVQKVIGNETVSPTNLDLYYWLALAHEASGQAREALAIYEKIRAEDMSFRDVEKRAERLRGVAPGAPAAKAPAPAPVAPPVAASPPAFAAPSTSPPPVAAPLAGAPRGPRFVTREEIGRGPLGVVHRGEDQIDGRGVAVRMLAPGLIQGAGVLPAVAADLKAASQLSHPNLVKVLGLVEIQGQRCLVTELVSGKTFAEALKLGRRMPFPQVHGLGRVLAQTLSFVHGKGLVHGSIQPSNVMVTNGVVKVADLGLGRLAHGLPKADDYRAPEKLLDVAGDLHAMAAVLYHLLTGAHPLAQAQGVGLPLPSTLAPGVPESLDKLLLRCLHPRPELRFATADEILVELKEMVRIG